MPFTILTRPRLKVLSAICSDLVVVWLVALFAADSAAALTKHLILATLFLFLAFQAEGTLEEP